MDATERIARVEERLARVERVLGLRAAGAIAAPSRTLAPAPAPAPEADAPLFPRAPGEPVAGGAPGAAPAPFPVAPPRPEPAPALAPLPARRRPGRDLPAPAPRRDLEGVVGVAVLGRLGIASLLLAAAYFAQLAYRALSPELRVFGVYALAAALVGIGAWLRGRVAPRYVALLWGGGVAAAYLAGVVAKLRYDLVSPGAAVAMLVGACALGQALARIARLPVLAHVALAGAFAAPLLVGSPVDARTALLAYVVALNAWAAWSSGRFGWAGVRGISLVGSAVLGSLWFAAHGGVDVSSYLHAHGYLLSAFLPELVDLARGRRLGRLRGTGLVAAASLVEAVLIFGLDGRGLDGRLAAFPLVAGAFWLAVAVASRAAAVAPRGEGVRGLARLGYVLLAFGAVSWASDAFVPADNALAALLVLAAVGSAAVLLARWLGTGGGPAVVAAVVGVLLLPAWSPAAPVAALALVVPLALVVGGVGGRAPWRPIGLGLAGIACFLAFPRAGDPTSLLAAFAAAAGIVAGAAVLARRRGEDVLAVACDVAFLALGATWSWHAFAGDFVPLGDPLLNAGTGVAALLAASVAAVAAARSARPEAAGRGVAPVATGLLVALVALAGWREVVDATQGLVLPGARDALRVLYVALASGVLLLLGALRRGPWARVAALAGLGLSAAMALGPLPDPESLGWAAAAVAGPALVALAAALRLPRERAGERVAAAAVLLVLAFAWAFAGWADGLATDPAFANLRFAVGIGLVAALLLAGRGLGTTALSRLVPWATGAVALLAFVVGWVEVRATLTGLSSPQWRGAIGSVYGTLASAAALAVGFRAKAAHLRWMGLAGFGVVVGKVGLHDLASVDTPLRVLVTGCLGVVLLVAAYAYARKARGDAPPPGPAAPSLPSAPAP